MTVKLQLSTDIEAKLRQQAAATGQEVADFVLQAVTEKLADADLQAAPSSRNPKDWKEKLRALIDLHPATTHIVDDSRESIYAGRGE